MCTGVLLPTAMKATAPTSPGAANPAAAETASRDCAVQPAATNATSWLPSPAASPSLRHTASSPAQQSPVASNTSHGGFSQCFQECMDRADQEAAACLPSPHSPVLLSRCASPAGAEDSSPGIISASLWLAGDGQQQQQQQQGLAAAGSGVSSWAGTADGWGGPVFAPRAPSPMLSTSWVTEPMPGPCPHQHQQRHPSPFSSPTLSPTPSCARLAPSATAQRLASPGHSPNVTTGVPRHGSGPIEAAAVAAADRLLCAGHGSPDGSSSLTSFPADNALQQQLQLMQLSAGNSWQQQQHMLAGNSWQQQQRQQSLPAMMQFASNRELPGCGSISCDLAVPCGMPCSTSQAATAEDDAAMAAVDLELLQLLQLRQQLVESRLAPGRACSASSSPRHAFPGNVLPVGSHQDMQAVQAAASWAGGSATPLCATDSPGRRFAPTSPGVAMADFVAHHHAAQQRHRACMSALEAHALQGGGGAAVPAGASSLSAEARSKLQELLVIQQLQLNLQDELLALCNT